MSADFKVTVGCGYIRPSVTSAVPGSETQKVNVGCLATTVYTPIGAMSTSFVVKTGVVPTVGPLYHS